MSEFGSDSRPIFSGAAIVRAAEVPHDVQPGTPDVSDRAALDRRVIRTIPEPVDEKAFTAPPERGHEKQEAVGSAPPPAAAAAENYEPADKPSPIPSNNVVKIGAAAVKGDAGLAGTEGKHVKPAATTREARRPAAELSTQEPTPQHVYIGSYAGDQPGFDEWYRTRNKELSKEPLPGEAKHTAEEDVAIDRIEAAAITVAKELGIVGMEERLPEKQQHHIFASETAYVEGVRAKWGDGDKVSSQSGFSDPTAGVVWTRSPDPDDNVYGLAHEKMHDVSVITVQPYPLRHEMVDGEMRPHYRIHFVQGGYRDIPVSNPRGHFNPLTELGTEMVTFMVLAEAGYPAPDSRYTPLGLLGEQIVLKTAEEYGVDPTVVANGIVRGLWTPDRAVLPPIRRALGDVVVDNFLRLEPEMDVPTARQAAMDLGLTKAIPDLRAYARGERIDLFNWDRHRPLARRMARHAA